jgi:FMN-dependent NADH-azoreductase
MKIFDIICFSIYWINTQMEAMNILQIKSSLFGDAGQSSRLANEFVAALLERNPGAELVVRDLVAEAVPHLDAARLAAFGAKDQATPEQRAVVEYSDALIDELRRADVLVLGLPMYNFGVPSQLKAWYDHVARAGITFRYTGKGPEGLLKGKKAYIFAARGGEYAAAANDWQAQFVRQILGFIGITDVEMVLAEGLAISEARKEAALAQARSALRRLVPHSRLAA